ncbi:MAG: hypothetical protein K0M45_02650 [Candidatus Paracaedibacteraceae bacterium]|nr:hypothetical protein [Candidatus Paracaedibacteraceae bacterium]
MTQSNPNVSYKKIRALKIIAVLLLSSTRLEAALDIYATNSTIGASLEYPDGGGLDGMELRPGVIATMADPEGIDFNDGSSLVFDVIGYNVGLIDASNTNGAIFFAEGSSIFMDVVGTPPPNGTYDLIHGELGAETVVRVILRNYPDATIITDYNEDNRYLRATILNFNRPSVPQTVINQTTLTSDTTFNPNIIKQYS